MSDLMYLSCFPGMIPFPLRIFKKKCKAPENNSHQKRIDRAGGNASRDKERCIGQKEWRAAVFQSCEEKRCRKLRQIVGHPSGDTYAVYGKGTVL